MHYLPSLQQISVACALVVFLFVLIRNHRQKKPHSLERLLAKLLAGSALPTGTFLILCAFDTSLVSKLTDLNLHLAAAGMALLFVSVKEISAD